MTRQEAFTMLDQMAKGIAEMFGSNCETVIHDLADPLHPVLAIYNGLVEKIERFAPDAVSIERVFAQENRNTVLGTAQAAGLAMLAAAQRGIPVALHTPTESKLAITGNGKAEKIQMERMVARILGLNTLPKPADAADALAIAICHALRPAGALQGGEREQHLTAAQRQWAQASQKAARRQGVRRGM